MFVFVADLRLGTADEREDFLDWGSALHGPEAHLRVEATARLDRLFLEFVRWKLASAATKGVLPTLVLLGNTFDFWQTRQRREAPADCLTRILSVHLEFTVAIREWMAAGGEVSLVIGSRDQALVEPSAWERLMEIFPQLNLHTQGRWTHYFTQNEAGLYAEHGGRWNPFCRTRDLTKWNAQCSAAQLVQELGRRLEPRFPWLDKVESFGELMRWLNVLLEGPQQRFYAELIQRLLRKRSAMSRTIAPWLNGKPVGWQSLADREAHSFHQGILSVRRKSTRPTQAPHTVKFLAHGHSRIPSIQQPTPRGPIVLCPGTWCPTVTGSPEAPKMEQPLPYVELHAPTEELQPQGPWQATLGHWRTERQKALKTKP